MNSCLLVVLSRLLSLVEALPGTGVFLLSLGSCSVSHVASLASIMSDYFPTPSPPAQHNPMPPNHKPSSCEGIRCSVCAVAQGWGSCGRCCEISKSVRSPNVDGDCLAAHPRGAVVDLVLERGISQRSSIGKYLL